VGECIIRIINLIDLPKPYSSALKQAMERLEPFKNEIVCIGIAGSVSRGDDFIPGYSDIDLVVITRDEHVIEDIKKVIDEINRAYYEVLRGMSPIEVRKDVISLWIDSIDKVFSWLGRGCEYYNLMKNFIVIYGIDVRSKLRKPSEAELILSALIVLRQIERKMHGIKSVDLKSLNTISIGSLIFPLLRFYLCIKGFHTASRREMIRILRENKMFSEDEIEALELVFKDMKSLKLRVDPEVNLKLYSLAMKIVREMESFKLKLKLIFYLLKSPRTLIEFLRRLLGK